MKLLLTCLILGSSLNSQALEYNNRYRDTTDIIFDQMIVFGGHALGYWATQRDTISNEGSFEKWQDNFLQFRFDSDNTTWNYFGHTITGSQVYLYYRARGHDQNEAFYLSFLSSLWFEVFIETYTEKPSFQDTFNTPIFGSVLGHYLEKASVYLVNSDNSFYYYLGRAINPLSYLVEENKMALIPMYKSKDNFSLTWTYFYD